MFNRKEYIKNYQEKHKEKIRKYNRKRYQDNKEKIDKQKRQWHEKNPGYMKKYLKQYREKNKEKIKILNKQWQLNNPKKTKENNKRYREKYPEKIREGNNDYCKNKRRTNLKFNINCKMKIAIYQSLKGNKLGRHWEDLVGYTLKDLIKRLKGTIPKGYTWKDYLRGRLHIDHIIPMTVFVFNKPEDKEFKDCWSLYNLRLLTKENNISKKDNINNPILLGLLLKEVI